MFVFECVVGAPASVCHDVVHVIVDGYDGDDVSTNILETYFCDALSRGFKFRLEPQSRPRQLGVFCPSIWWVGVNQPKKQTLFLDSQKTERNLKLVPEQQRRQLAPRSPRAEKWHQLV